MKAFKFLFFSMLIVFSYACDVTDDSAKEEEKIGVDGKVYIRIVDNIGISHNNLAFAKNYPTNEAITIDGKYHLVSVEDVCTFQLKYVLLNQTTGVPVSSNYQNSVNDVDVNSYIAEITKEKGTAGVDGKDRYYTVIVNYKSKQGEIMTNFQGIEFTPYTFTDDSKITYANQAEADVIVKPVSKLDANGYPKELSSLLTQTVLDGIKQLGIAINSGENPPMIEGSLKNTLKITFLVSPCVLLTSTVVPKETVGKVFYDETFSFYNQDNSKLTLKLDYTSGGASGETGSGLGAYIIGSGSKFTVLATFDSQFNGTKAKMMYIISGTLTSTGIKDIEFCNLMIDNYGNPKGNWIGNGQGRKFYDSDKSSEKVSNP